LKKLVLTFPLAMFKIPLAVVTLLTDWFFTGWILNWAPLETMLVGDGFYANLCTVKLEDEFDEDFDKVSFAIAHEAVACPAQTVAISKLWSSVLFSEFTVLFSGIALDWIGPKWMTLVSGILHVIACWGMLALDRDSPYLMFPFFCAGTACQACGLIVMRSVFIWDTIRGRQKWILIACVLFDSSAVTTMIYLDIWQTNALNYYGVVWSILIMGAILFGAQFLLWQGFELEMRYKLEGTEEERKPLLEKNASASTEAALLAHMNAFLDGEDPGPPGSKPEEERLPASAPVLSGNQIEEIEVPDLNATNESQSVTSMDLEQTSAGIDPDSLTMEVDSYRELFSSGRTYLFLFLCLISIYRIRYFLGLIHYTLQELGDRGLYLTLLGYSFALGAVFALPADWLLPRLNFMWQFHLTNASITLFFVFWLIPSLPVQVLNFVTFIFARLVCFSTMFTYAGQAFGQSHFGVVTGLAFVTAAIPGAFTFAIVQLVLDPSNDVQFWHFHVMCLLLSIPTAIVITAGRRFLNLQKKDEDFDDVRSVMSEIHASHRPSIFAGRAHSLNGHDSKSPNKYSPRKFVS